jgi:hypothetical protein
MNSRGRVADIAKSTLDVHPQAITTAKQNARAAVMSLAFPSE